MKKRTKILVSCVGLRDPFNEDDDTEGSILTSVRAFKPDVLYLMPTMDKPNSKSNTQEKAEQVKLILEDLGKDLDISINCYIRPLNTTDPRDYSKLKQEFQNKLSVIYEEHPNGEYFNNISSGTSQMASVWLILKNGGFLKGKLYNVSEPKYVDNPVPENRVNEVVMDFMEEENIFNRTMNFLKNYSFEYASDEMEELEQITTFETRILMAGYFKELFLAYSHWEHLRYDLAKNKIHKILNEIEHLTAYEEIYKLLTKQYKLLQTLISIQNENIEKEEILLDFYHRMKRKFLINDYSAALARFWRLYEGTLFYILRENYNIEPTCLKKSVNKKFVKTHLSYINNLKHGLNLFKCTKLLEEINDPTYLEIVDTNLYVLTPSKTKKERKLSNIFDYLRKIRNDSSVAHGFNPVEDFQASQAIDSGKKLLEIIFDSDVSSYPFDDTFINPYITFIAGV